MHIFIKRFTIKICSVQVLLEIPAIPPKRYHIAPANIASIMRQASLRRMETTSPSAVWIARFDRGIFQTADDCRVPDCASSDLVAHPMLHSRVNDMSSAYLSDRPYIKTTKNTGQMPGFRSFKTSAPILYPARWHHDLLIQLTLNPYVTGISPCSTKWPNGGLNLFIDCGGEIFQLTAMRDEDFNQLQFLDSHLFVKRSVVLSEPSLSNARAIWSTRRTPISPSNRLRVLERLAAHPSGLPISQLTNCIQNSSADPIDTILALVCLGLSILDLGLMLCPDTIIRLNSLSDRDGSRRPQNSFEHIGGLLAKVKADQAPVLDDGR